jgi:hypothetical protein
MILYIVWIDQKLVKLKNYLTKTLIIKIKIELLTIKVLNRNESKRSERFEIIIKYAFN